VIVARIGLILLFAVAAGGCGSRPAQRADGTAQPVPLDRQILVMLKEQPLRRYQPGAMWMPLYGGAAPAQQARVAQDLAREYELQMVSDWPMPALGVRCFLVAVPPPHTQEEIVSRLASDPRVESVQAVQTFHALGHNDPYYPLQTSAALLRLDELHQMAKGRRVTIAEIDSGVDLDHPELRGQLGDAVNFVDEAAYAGELHGTAVAGIMVAKADNRVGIVGVAPEAKLLPLRACWQRPHEESGAICSSFTLAKAIQYALVHDARVLNLSLAGPPDRLLERLVEKAIAHGVTVVGAIDPGVPDASFPAHAPDVIAVASAEIPGAADGVIYAPGERVLTTTPHASYGFVSGSSFATAHVTGVVALLLESSPGLKPKDIHRLLHRHTSGTASGRGPMLDACGLLASVSASNDCRCCETVASPPARRRDGDPPS
jgi:hypothetical protein